MAYAGMVRNWPAVVAAALTVAVVAGPVAAVAVSALTDSALSWREMGMLVLPAGRRLTLLLNSIILSGAAAVTCMLLSWLIGTWLWQQTRRRPNVTAYAAVFIWFMALLPPFVHSYTWMAIFGSGSPFSGLTAGWWTQTMAWLPLCLSVTLLGFRCIDYDLIDAAQLVASPLRVLMRVVTPLLAPALLAGGSLVFLLGLQEYSIPSLFQISTYSLEIFSDYSAFHQPVRALLLSVPLTVISGGALLAMKPWFRHVAAMPTRSRVQTTPFLLPSWFCLLQYAGILLLAIQMLLPLMMLTKTVGTADKLVASVLAAAPEIWFSLRTALVSAVTATALSILIVGAMPSFWQSIVMPLTVTSFCVPATLTGIGLILLCNDTFLSALYSSDAMPVAAAIARFGPLAWLIAVAQHRRQDASLIEAASLFPVSTWKIWSAIRLPLMFPGLTVAAMTVFLLTMGELSATLLVLPPGSHSLAVKTYNLLHYGASDAVAGLCLFLVGTGWLTGLAAVMSAVRRRDDSGT